MGIGISVFLIAVGAILAFAVDVTVSGLDLDTVGVILMIAGGIGLLWSLLFLNGGWGRGAPVVDEYVDEPVARRRVIRDRYMQ
ncbi:MAG TPA: DUF6458 family protein [Acidimicrobiales bacterium]|nr:DUF6458 family protein [Acidimicrobiales bacterium]